MKKHKTKKIVILSVIFVIVFEAIFLLVFKKIRFTIPPPEIGEDKLIGFAQYYGYPIYYDTFYFIFLLFLPITIFFIVYKNYKKT